METRSSPASTGNNVGFRQRLSHAAESQREPQTVSGVACCANAPSQSNTIQGCDGRAFVHRISVVSKEAVTSQNHLVPPQLPPDIFDRKAMFTTEVHLGAAALGRYDRCRLT
jgi:hypothetical protein